MKSISKIPFSNGVEGLILHNKTLVSDSVKKAFHLLSMPSSNSINQDKQVEELLEGNNKPTLLKMAQKLTMRNHASTDPLVTTLQERTTAVMLGDVPDYLSHLKHVLNWYNYPGKFQTSRLLGHLVSNRLLVDEDSSLYQPSDKLLNLSACAEAMILGEHLFMHTENGQALIAGLPPAVAGLVASKVSEKNIMLSGDFFFASAAKRSVQLGSDTEVYILSCINEIHFTKVNAAKRMIDSGSSSELENYLAAAGTQLTLLALALNTKLEQPEYIFSLGVLAELNKLYGQQKLANPYATMVQGVVSKSGFSPILTQLLIRKIVAETLSKIPKSMSKLVFK